MSSKKVKNKKKPISKIIFMLTSLLSIWGPVLVFQKLFLNKMEYYNPYNNELVLPLLLCITYILLCVWFVPMFKNIIFKVILFIIIPLLLISYIFFDIAYANRIEFGNTWTNTDVFIELVCSQNFYIPLLLIGVSLNFIVNLWYFKSK